MAEKAKVMAFDKKCERCCKWYKCGVDDGVELCDECQKHLFPVKRKKW